MTVPVGVVQNQVTIADATIISSEAASALAAGDADNDEYLFVIPSDRFARDDMIRRGPVQLCLQNYPKTSVCLK